MKEKNNLDLKLVIKIDDYEIKKKLKELDIQTNNYFLATCIKNAKQYILTGKIEEDTIINYIICYDKKYVYMIQLSTINNKLLTNKNTISQDKIVINNVRRVLFGFIYKFTMKTEDIDINLQANKKVANLKNQKLNIENFIKLFKK